MKITKAQRAWVYALALAALPLLVFYGLVAPEASPLWLGFVLALLNLSDKPPRESSEYEWPDMSDLED